MFRRISVLALSLLCVSAFAQYPGSADPPEDTREGFQAIQESLLKEWLGYLAGPECQGRGSGQPGYQKAAEYIAARFREFGLKPGGDEGTFFQNVPFTKIETVASESSMELSTGVKLPFTEGIAVSGANESATVEGGVAFVRFGSGDLDLSQLDGKMAIVVGGEMTREARLALFRARPAIVLTVTDGMPAADPTIVPPGRSARGGRLAGEISRDLAERIATAIGVSLPGEDRGATVLVTPVTAKLSVTTKQETLNVPNVVGVLEGSDPVLKSEVVGFGAHLDHLGRRGDTIYWGADDDGSGSTALLAVAYAFAKNPVKPKRTLVFLAFCGEEMGLIGSRYYTEHPTFPMDKMICHLQMDMVGRNEETDTEPASENEDTIHLVGSKRLSSELHALVLSMNKYVNFRFEYDEEDVFGRSDHVNFHNKGVPVAFLFDGFHPDYHQPTDTVDKINFRKIASAARLFYLVGIEAAQRDAPFKKDSGGSASNRKAA
ncbi:MAG: hypothetical protein KatS3mg015_0432 [Fimbriimonadales bacterium]|nr:MAG: hypothetical protein KatS3mg015_0432 [Fimbriimonadales bacterium]